MKKGILMLVLGSFWAKTEVVTHKTQQIAFIYFIILV